MYNFFYVILFVIIFTAHTLGTARVLNELAEKKNEENREFFLFRYTKYVVLIK